METKQAKRILLTGATGFVGRALCLRLRREGYEVVAWVRNRARARQVLEFGTQLISTHDNDGLVSAVQSVDAIIHLAGEPVSAPAHTAAARDRLTNSRVETTERLLSAVAKAKRKPRAFISASAVGYYGNRADEEIDESTGPGEGFLSNLCIQWEKSASAGRDLGLRCVQLRIGLVLGSEGGLLDRLLPIFHRGLGGKIGSGQQYMAWIHMEDLLETLILSIENEEMEGPYNATTPTPETNAAFTQILASILERPAPFPVPAFALRALFGTTGKAFAEGQRAVPKRLLEIGFTFKYTNLEDALKSVVVPAHYSSIGKASEIPDKPYLHARKPQYLLSTHILVDAPRDRVFSFFSHAENLGAITPPALSFAIVGGDPKEMKSGTTIDYRIKLSGVPMTWRTLIDGWDPPHYFSDTQEQGPYSSWYHEHLFHEKGNQTLMEDRVFYRPPLGPVGKVSHSFFIRDMLSRIFAFRRHAILYRFGLGD